MEKQQCEYIILTQTESEKQLLPVIDKQRLCLSITGNNVLQRYPLDGAAGLLQKTEMIGISLFG